MPKLDKLIRELCSDGVQVFRLEEIAHYAKTRIDCKTINEDNYVGVENLLQNKAGKTKATSVPTTGMVIAYQKNDILIGNIRPYLRKVWLADCEGGTNGDVLTVQIEDGYSGTYKIDRDAVVISSIGANTGAVYYKEAFFTPIIRLKVILPKDNRINARFLFHALSGTTIKSKSSSVPNMNANEIKAIKIPVPPLDVQNRIVNVLDNFEKICSDLNIGLPAEIEARQKQYE